MLPWILLVALLYALAAVAAMHLEGCLCRAAGAQGVSGCCYTPQEEAKPAPEVENSCCSGCCGGDELALHGDEPEPDEGVPPCRCDFTTDETAPLAAASERPRTTTPLVAIPPPPYRPTITVVRRRPPLVQLARPPPELAELRTIRLLL